MVGVSSLRAGYFDIWRSYAFFLQGLTPPLHPAPAKAGFCSWCVRALWRVARSTRVAQFCGLFRLFWRKRHWYCATVAASGGSFPRSPLGAGWHLCCLALRFAGAQSGLAVCKRFEWMRFGVRLAVCKRLICRPVASPSAGERAVRMRINCATQSGATAASDSAADERRTSRRAFTTPGCKGECKLY